MSGELTPTERQHSEITTEIRPEDEVRLRSRLREFAIRRTSAHAADALGAAWMLGRAGEADAAARKLIDDLGAPKPARALAASVLLPSGSAVLADEPSTEPSHLRDVRAKLRLYSRNPLLWVDLALLLATRASLDEARRALEVGLRLEPENRFVLRSAARFFVHVDDPERANDLLRKAIGVRHDPWILAAEIATAGVAGRTSKLVRAGRQVAKSGHFGPFHTAELATALGTVEAEAGDQRRTRQWVRQALSEPTENALAQAVWLARHDETLRSDLPDPSASQRAPAWEAEALASFNSGSWQKSIVASKRWYEDEPFSARSAIHGSFVSAVALADWEASIGFADLGLEANPNDNILLNNRAFALACLGRPLEAQRTLEKINPSDSDDPSEILHFRATAGAVRFAAGDMLQGQRFYREVIEEAGRRKLYSVQAMAAVFLARALITAGMSDQSEQVLREASAALGRLDSSESRLAIQSAIRRLHNLPHTANVPHQ